MKKLSLDKCITYLLLLCSTIAFNSCVKNLTQKNIVFSNDFENSQLKGIFLESFFGPTTYNKIFNFNGSKVLGRFNNAGITISLGSLPEHNAMNVEFLLNIHDQWEGNHLNAASGIPDIWQMKVDDNVVLLTTFSNTGYQQAYPNFYLFGDFPAKRNAFDINLPGICALQAQAQGTSTYKIVKTFAHSATTFKLQCSDALQPFNDSCLKSWSIDDIVITAIKY